MIVRSLLLACAVLLLGACNRLTTDKPVLESRDISGPQLRSGVWLQDDWKCSVQQRAKAESWPDCAEWMLARAGDFAELDQEQKPPLWKSKPYVLAGSQAPGGAQALQVTDNVEDDDFTLWGVRALQLDPEGRATKIRRWPISCGSERVVPAPAQEKAAPPPPPTDGGPPSAEPAAPKSETVIDAWPGVVMTNHGNCRPRDAQGLLEAAAASEDAMSERSETFHWVREKLP